MANGEGCTCNAWCQYECCCDADWTTTEVYDLRAEIESLKFMLDIYRLQEDVQVKSALSGCGLCPQCSQLTVVKMNGCDMCIECGYSECG